MSAMLPIDMLLLQYAAGSLSPAESLVVAAHLTLRPEARRKVSLYETMGGRMIHEESPVTVGIQCRDAVFERVDACGVPAPSVTEDCTARKAHLRRELKLQEPLLSLLSGCCADDSQYWQSIGTGLETMNIHLASSFGDERRLLKIIRMAPHQVTPVHRHSGVEITLVLEGGFSDASGHYQKGDVVIIRDPSYAHRPVADETGCLCLNLTEAPLRFEQPLQRLMNLLWQL